MSKFSLRDVIRQEIVQALQHRKDPYAAGEIERIQNSKSLTQAFGFAGPGFEPSAGKGETYQGPGGAKGFLGPGFKK